MSIAHVVGTDSKHSIVSINSIVGVVRISAFRTVCTVS